MPETLEISPNGYYKYCYDKFYKKLCKSCKSKINLDFYKVDDNKLLSHKFSDAYDECKEHELIKRREYMRKYRIKKKETIAWSLYHQADTEALEAVYLAHKLSAIAEKALTIAEEASASALEIS